MFFVYFIHTFFLIAKKVKFDLRPVFPAASKLNWYARLLTKKKQNQLETMDADNFTI